MYDITVYSKSVSPNLFYLKLKMATNTSYFDKLLVKSDTTNGHDWAMKALHPPSDKGTSYNGYPDQSTIPAIHSEYRQNFESLPVISDDEKSSVLLLLTPGLFGPVWAATAVTSTQTNGWRLPYQNSLLQRSDLGTNFIKRRLAYKSTTIQLDATAFTNQGMGYCGSFNPSVDIITGAQALVRYAHCKRSTDLIHSTIQKYVARLRVNQPSDNRNDVNDEGYEVLSSGRNPTPRSTPNINTVMVQIVKLGNTITNPSDVTMLSPKSYVGRATEGVFCVQQCNQPVNSWLDLAEHRYSGGVANTTDGCYLTFYEQQHTTGGAVLYYLRDVNGSDFDFLEVDMRNWEWKFVYFQNLSAYNGNQPLLSFKIVHGEEWAPSPRGFLNALALPPALFDRAAIDSVAIITQSRQDGMPAKYNMLGALGAIASSVAPSMVANLVDSQSDTPQEAKLLKKVIHSSDVNTATQQEVDNANKAPIVVEPQPPKRRQSNRQTPKNARPNVNTQIARINKKLNSLKITSKPVRNNKRKPKSQNAKSSNKNKTAK